ncbi:MAG: immune inhibitor A [Candidatus Thermoplasmatota archaeon]|nr:immune inhibitor A [Candidatus Thermoplasmatota archaeon]MBU1941312.1 immune inhibitor A [Candidatus Thermoplasmatota archaeon]
MLVRLSSDLELTDLPRNTEIVAIAPNQWIDVIIDAEQLIEFIQQGIAYGIQIPDVQAYLNTIRGSYHTLAQMESMLLGIASSYPSITSLYSIGTTYEGRDIWCLEISDNPGIDEGEPGILFMGVHHAREWPTLEICLHIADELTSGYGSNPTITNLIDNRRIWLITCVNPDGYYYCHDLGNDWRKNRHYFSEFDSYGVDLNRNYGGASNGNINGIWGSVGGASVTHKSNQEVYCGPGPFSELEAQAVRNLYLQNEICATITWHTYGQYVLWSWSYEYPDAPDGAYLASVGIQIASAITRQSGSGSYTAQQGSDLYPTTGDTTDWVYGYHHYILGRPSFAYTIEACETFHPSESYLDQVVAENFDGALVLLQEAENIRDTVSSRVLPPEIDEMITDSDGNYSISWVEKNPDAMPTKFQLDELSALSFVEDDAESTMSLWFCEGFTSSTKRAHSGTHSYRSAYLNEETSAITSTEPFLVSDGMILSFWCWYDIEANWDFAFVEVSTNGRIYDILDSFTGTSGGWVEKQYDLSAYAGKSIVFRFRYTTDANTLEEGFYIDDISPLPSYASITTLSDIITNHSFEVNGRPEGVYYYRVRGFNSGRGWGDFSLLEDIEVVESYNQAPEIPSIEGNARGKAGIEYSYVFTTSDLNDDSIWYFVDWGDGSTSGWMGPFNSSESMVLTHTWVERDTYTIQCKAKDTFDAESNWGTLTVQMPYIKIFSLQILSWLIQRFPLLQRLFFF